MPTSKRKPTAKKHSYPAPTFADHAAFCKAEGWSEVRSATGGRVRHHATYELALPDGRVLRTRMSRPPDGRTYGPALWAHILRDQLEVDEGTFWRCVQDGVLPSRTASVAIPVVQIGRAHV